MPYLDEKGLARFWGKVKNALSKKQDTLTAGDNITIEQQSGVLTISAAIENTLIEEYDTDDGWHVRKHGDGYVEMITSIVVNSGIMREWGSWYVQEDTVPSRKNYPIALTKKYAEIASADCDISFSLLTIRASTLTETGSYGIARGNSSNNKNCIIHIFVSGRWK